MKQIVRFMMAGSIALLSVAASAGQQASSQDAGRNAAEARIIQNFAQFAGSEDNSRNLLSGLREGRQIALVARSRDTASPAATKATFTSPTPAMGYLGAFLSLGLARQQLALYGITQPAPNEIKAALLGGTIVAANQAGPQQLRGVLRMQAQGMGWGQMATVMGIKLSAVVGEARREMLAGAGGKPTVGAPMKAVWYFDGAAVAGRFSPLPTR